MNIIFYKVSDSDNTINKTLLSPKTETITLRKRVDISNPELLLKFDSTILDYNYCYIPDLERYYFMRSIDSINNQIWKVSLEIDVLETYKATILSSNAAFRKQVEAGDYGNIQLETTGKETVTEYDSNVTLVEGNTTILSVMGVK